MTIEITRRLPVIGVKTLSLILRWSKLIFGKNLHIGNNNVNRQNNTRSTNDHVPPPQQKEFICNSSKDTSVPKY